MRFLTVAERELRSAARRRGTHRVRWATAGLFLGLLLWLLWLFDAGSRRGAGADVFQACSILTFLYCLVIGTAVTADCLSSERREGTLGLLFLTNLNSAEIVAGKFCSTALSAVYGLAAIFPMLALPMLMGGTTLAHFWKTILALVVTVFFAMASGFVATTVCRRQFTAIAFALGLAMAYGTGPLGLVSALRSRPPMAGWADDLAAFCPLYMLVSADGTRVFGGNRYWFSVVAVTGVALCWLALVAMRLARSWRDGSRVRAGLKWPAVFGRRPRAAGAAGPALRRRLLDINPFLWLAARGRISSPVFMLLVVLMTAVCSFALAPWLGRVFPAGAMSPLAGHMFAWLWTGLALHLMTAYLAAMVASQRLAEDKHSGALELILSTPASERTIARGLWLAYARRLFAPGLVAGLVHLFFIWQCLALMLVEEPMRHLRGATEWQLFWSAVLERPLNGQVPQWHFGVVLRGLLLALALLMLSWVTLGWLGRWLGLRMKHPGFAPVVALAFVFVPPVALFSLVCYLADQFGFDQLPERQFIPVMMWLAFFIGVGHFALLACWSHWRLRTEFRAVVMNRFQPVVARAWWRISVVAVRRLAWVATILMALALLLVAGFYGYQNWRGHRQWAAFQRGLKQAGMSLELARFLPAPVPDGDNFARSPAFQSLLDGSDSKGGRLLDAFRFSNHAYPGLPVGGAEQNWSGQSFLPLQAVAQALSSITPLSNQWRPGAPSYGKLLSDTNRATSAALALRGLEAGEASLRNLAVAARRPYFQTDTNADAGAVLSDQPKQLEILERVHFLFQFRAGARLAIGQPGPAGEDLLTSLRLAHLARQSSDVRSCARAQALTCASLQPLWEGLVEHRWTGPQLSAFQDELARFNFLGDYTNAVARVVLAQIELWRGRAEGRPSSFGQTQSRLVAEARIRQWQPQAWWFRDCIQLHHAGQNVINQMDVANGFVGTEYDWEDLNGLPLDADTRQLLQQQNWWGVKSAQVGFAQNAVHQAILACALERYRLARGRYPDKLDHLGPDFLAAVPNDPMRGRPLAYEREQDERFTLRGAGPNKLLNTNRAGSDDWLWAFPTNAAATK